MVRRSIPALLIVPVLSFPVFSGPKIKFDVTSFDCGIVIEGKTEKLNAVFKVTNTGDATLNLINVRPGCGCTIVKYDSVVAPGKSVNIESQVNIQGYRPGPIAKYVTVTSNAVNEGTVRLEIKAVIKALVSTSETYLELTAPDTTTPKAVTLYSVMKDLKVFSVTFKPSNMDGAAAWERNLPLLIRYTFAPVDSLTSDSTRVFRLQLFSPASIKEVGGTFLIATNHPDKKEISLPGRISR